MAVDLREDNLKEINIWAGGVPPQSVRVAARLRSLPYAMEKLFSRAGRHPQLNRFESSTAAAPSACRLGFFSSR